MKKRGLHIVMGIGLIVLAQVASAQESIKSSALQKAIAPKGSVAIARTSR